MVVQQVRGRAGANAVWSIRGAQMEVHISLNTLEVCINAIYIQESLKAWLAKFSASSPAIVAKAEKTRKKNLRRALVNYDSRNWAVYLQDYPCIITTSRPHFKIGCVQ